VASLYHKSTPGTTRITAASDLLRSITDFLSSSRKPAVLEAGEKVAELLPGEYALEIRGDRLWIETWSTDPALSRRILNLEDSKPGVLECAVHRFGGKPGKLSFLDLDRPQVNHHLTSGLRQNFSEQFRHMLFRQYPNWQIRSLSTGPDLQRSFSARFPRAKLARGNQVVAAIACPAAEAEPDLLTFALLWFDHLRVAAGDRARVSLAIFLPAGAGNLTAHRLRWLRSDALRTQLFLFNEHGSAGEVDPQDLGNLQTRVSPHYLAPETDETLSSLLSGLAALPDVSHHRELGGSVSLRFRGLEFARIEGRRFLLGIEDRQEITADPVEKAAAYLTHLREASHELSPMPERWLESAVRANLALIDPTLTPEPVHSQVLSFAAGDRDLIDLLAVAPDGRLTVLELKATEDLHLPLQALDYWMRIRWHRERSELQHLFPGTVLSLLPPKLLLVAPAFSFHSSNSIVLRYFSPDVEVERIGVNSDWQGSFKVVLRLRGADAPISHGRFHVTARSEEHTNRAPRSEP
jgi:hypothetical protein